MKSNSGQLHRLTALAGTVLLASACVSGSSSVSNPTPLPQYAAISPSSLDTSNVNANSQHVAEPTLALAATDESNATTATLATNQAISSANEYPTTVSTTPAGPLPSSVPSPAVRKNNVVQPQTVASLPSDTATTAARSETPAPVSTPATADAQVEQVKKPAKKSFLTRLFGGSRKKNKLISVENAEPTRAASLATTGTSRSGESLPGVKSNSQIFGIDDGSATNQQQTQVAALGSLGRISPNGLRLQHEKVQVACLKPDILRLIAIVERHYGKKPIITSGYRSPKRNRRAGGAKNSMHIFCKAVDLQVEGVSKWDLAKYLRTIPGRGGVGTYCRTRSVHIDTGSVRDWHYPCRRSSKRRKKKA